MGFVKHDQQKTRPDLIPADYLERMGEVMRDGAVKYSEDNWKKCKEPKRYLAAAFRHFLRLLAGEMYDKESGHHHALHIGCSIGMYFHLINQKEKCAADPWVRLCDYEPETGTALLCPDGSCVDVIWTRASNTAPIDSEAVTILNLAAIERSKPE